MEADLAFRGVDLGALVAQRRWRKVLNLVDHLPRDSAYGQALSDDEELADTLALGGASVSDARPPVAEWSPVMDVLAALYDRLGGVEAQLRASATHKPQRTPKPYPRPVTTAERIAAMRRRRAYDDIQRQLFPGGGD